MVNVSVVTSRLLLLLIIGGLMFAACNTFGDEDPGPVLTSSEAVELSDATSVEVDVEVNTSGDLRISDGAETLLNSRFTYNERLEPNLSYVIEEGRGMLEIDQPRRRNLDRDDLENEWDLQFGSSAPLDIVVEMSSGDTELDLSTLELTSLEVDTSSGNLDAVITGQQNRLERIEASTSSGNIGVVLDGDFQRLETIELDESSGNIELRLGGAFAALDRLSVDSSSGNTRIVIDGSWSRDLNARVDTSSGNVTLVVPSDIGVRISADVSSGNINADGFRIDDSDYVNDAYSTSDITLEFEIDVSSGNIDLELSE